MATRRAAAPASTTYDDIVSSITRDVFEHPRDLSRHLIETHGFSRVTAGKYIRRLESEGWIARAGSATHPVFSAGLRRATSHLYKLKQLEEHTLWERDFERFFNMAPNVKSIVQHGITEMVNNAIDHSEGRRVLVGMSQSDAELSLLVSDDGIGIFRKISAALQLPDMRQALFELSKGKFTTDPTRHSGEGVFFTSRAFDVFSIEANGLDYRHFAKARRGELVDGKTAGALEGTTVYMSIATNCIRTLNDVYSQYTKAPEDFDFSKTVVPMKLAQYGGELVSRSQAKRLIARFDRFKLVVLDFDGVPEIGQAFADELFRVYAAAHPMVELVPTQMSDQVERMWRRALSHSALPPMVPRR